MHVPDGFLDAPTSVATGVVAAVAVGVALRGARRELDDRTAPLAGLVAAFIFADPDAQLPGRVRHQRPPARRRAGRGPGRPVHRAAVHGAVFLVQCLLFADGGITALGTNIDLMGLVTVVVGWLVFKALQAVLPKRLSMVAPSAGIAALVSVPVAALGLRGPLRRRRHRRPLARPPRHRDGRRARADRASARRRSPRSRSAASSPSAPTSCYGARPVLAKRELVDHSTRRAGRRMRRSSTKVVRPASSSSRWSWPASSAASPRATPTG